MQWAIPDSSFTTGEWTLLSGATTRFCRVHVNVWRNTRYTLLVWQYLNSGAGGVAGLFLHNRYALDPPKHLHGWWGNKYDTRFDMAEKIDLDVGADSFRLTNPSPWHACLQMASLEVTLRITASARESRLLHWQIFEDAGLDRILAKQFLLTGLLEYLIDQRLSDGAVTVHLITPRDPKERGSQLSLVFSEDVRKMYDELKKMAVVVSRIQHSQWHH